MKEYITKENKAALEAELTHLTTVKRKEIITAIEYAKSLGDLSENAEYHLAREEQGKLQERISMIEHVLRNSEVVNPKTDGTINIGSVIGIQKSGEANIRTLTMVGNEETDMLSGKISYKSPLGQVLYGKKVGMEVVVTTPKGEVLYHIVSVT
jgi:transcription elongation factor GreA